MPSKLPKPVVWMASTLKDMRALPEPVQDMFGFALYLAQTGDKHAAARPLRGFAGAGVLEVVEDFDGDTFRAVYTVRFVGAIYVLHVFQKKAKAGIKTPKTDIDLIERRLKLAEALHREEK